MNQGETACHLTKGDTLGDNFELKLLSNRSWLTLHAA